jgi:hypothetical protein
VTAKVPSVAGALENVTVSPSTKPFVLATCTLRGFTDVTPTVAFPVMFPATVAFEMSVPAGMEAYGQLPSVRYEFVATDATLNVPRPAIFTGKFVPAKPVVFANGTYTAEGVNRDVVTVF